MLSELLFNGPLKFGSPVVLYREPSWSFAIDVTKKQELSVMGRNIFGNNDEFEEYSKEFSTFMESARSTIVTKYGQEINELSLVEFEELVRQLKNFWRFYGLTEFVFHDFEMGDEKNPQLARNLEKLGELKMEARNLWNQLSVNGVLYFLLAYFSKTFFNGADSANYLLIDELADLLKGGRVDENIIQKRKACYVLAVQKESYSFLPHDEASEIVARFEKLEEEEIEKGLSGLKGVVANKGVAKGRVIIVPMLNLEAANEAAKKMQPGDILVAQSTDPNLMHFCLKAGAIITNQGGMLSHAAIISRELGIPCVVGTKIATKVLKDGDLVEVDANKGTVSIIKK